MGEIASTARPLPRARRLAWDEVGKRLWRGGEPVELEFQCRKGSTGRVAFCTHRRGSSHPCAGPEVEAPDALLRRVPASMPGANAESGDAGHSTRCGSSTLGGLTWGYRRNVDSGDRDCSGTERLRRRTPGNHRAQHRSRQGTRGGLGTGPTIRESRRTGARIFITGSADGPGRAPLARDCYTLGREGPAA